MTKRPPRPGEGRPTKYKPDFCQMLINHMGKGFSLESFAAVIEVSRESLYEWSRVHPEFSDSIKRGKDACMKYHEDIGLRGMNGEIPGFNVAAWIFSMKCRFKDQWTDRTDHNITVNKIESKDKTVLLEQARLVTELLNEKEDDEQGANTRLLEHSIKES